MRRAMMLTAKAPRRRLPPIESLCPYCAAAPSIPCPPAMQAYLFGYYHADDPEFGLMLLYSNLLDGLRGLVPVAVGPESI